MSDSNPPSTAGQWAAFEAEAMPHADRLFRLAMWFERDRREAEDLVQETLVQALLSFHRFAPGTNCRAWLVSILTHVRSNRRRARWRREAVEEVDDSIAETASFVPAVPQHITDEDMLAALRGVPAHYQDVILLCDVEEMTYKEIADAQAIPLGTVMSRLHRGRALLRKALAARQPLAEPNRADDRRSSPERRA
jgi:RNA polymerase sigma-70 factor (ECF subfamily)